MSYDYFLWRTNRVIESDELGESTVVPWRDADELRTVITELLPAVKWSIDGLSGDDVSGTSSIRAVRLPDSSKQYDPLVIRASRHASSIVDLIGLGERLSCLVYDTQTGEIVYQPT